MKIQLKTNIFLNNEEEEMMLSMQARNMKESRVIGFNASPGAETHALKMNSIMKQMKKCAFASTCGE